MSRLYKKLIAVPQGTTGDLVFRIRRGISYLCARPIPFMPGTKPEDIARRSRFGLTCRFSAQVNQIVKLKELWEIYEGQASSYNLITSANYRNVTAAGIQPGAVISPLKKALGLPIVSAALNNLEIQVEIDSMPPDTATVAETKVRLVSLICLSGPKDVNTPDYDFIPVVSPVQARDFTVPTIFNVALDSQDTLLFDLYNNQKVFYVLLTEDDAGKVYQHSRTYSH